MTTIIPTAKTTITLQATLQSPFHHGAGSSGNTSLLRTQEVVQPDGTLSRVPFLSAASIRHNLREVLAWHLTQTLEIADGELSKKAVDLLFTGGAVTSTGARTNLEMLRRVEQQLPMLTLLGYAAQSDIITGTLRASDMILICRENQWRLPEHTHQKLLRAAAYRTEEFGTRHDQSTSPAGRFIDVLDDLGTAQMIWGTQILAAGAQLHGELTLTTSATPAHEQWLYAALALWAPGGNTYLGAKTAQGYGRAYIAGIDHEQANNSLKTITQHITNQADEIRQLITDLTA